MTPVDIMAINLLEQLADPKCDNLQAIIVAGARHGVYSSAKRVLIHPGNLLKEIESVKRKYAFPLTTFDECKEVFSEAVCYYMERSLGNISNEQEPSKQEPSTKINKEKP